MGGFVPQNIYLGNDTHACDVNTPDDCPTCTLQQDCYNPCVEEDCEICFGQTDPLDPDCTEVGCTSGTMVGCVDAADCAPGTPGLDPNLTHFCLTGCCTPIPA
jgi:hypothetical protein